MTFLYKLYFKQLVDIAQENIAQSTRMLRNLAQSAKMLRNRLFVKKKFELFVLELKQVSVHSIPAKKGLPMLPGEIQIRAIHQPEVIPVSPQWGLISKLAIHAIRTVGLLLITACVGCIIAGFQVPAIALLVAGAVALVLGFALDREEVEPPAMAFGQKDWIEYIGDPGEVPPLPANIEEILAEPYRFWPGQTVADTHMLVLVPQIVTRMVNEKPVSVSLTVSSLNELVQSSHNDTGVGYLSIWQEILLAHGNTPVEKSYWILITKDVLPESRNKNYAAQKQLVENAGYEVPRCLEVATAILVEHVRSEERFFVDHPPTYTRCQEEVEDPVFHRGQVLQSVVGCFERRGLNVLYSHPEESREFYGIAALRRL